MAEKELHITIGSCPSPEMADQGPGITLRHDTELVKTALLYADKIKLCSPFSSVIDQIRSISSVMASSSFESKTQAIWDLGKMIDLSEGDIAALTAFSKLAVLRKHPTPNEIIRKRLLAKEFDKFWQDFETSDFRLPEGHFITQFLKVSRRGYLDFHRFHTGKPSTEPGQALSQFTELIRSTIKDESTYPLFDDQTGLLITIDIMKGELSVPKSTSTRSKQIGLVSKLFERLPQFELATLDEILDIRTDLDKYLTRFRSAIIKYSDSIAAAQWDAEFSHDTEQVFLKDVAPIIKDIEDQTRSNNYLAKLTKRYADQPANFMMPVLSIALTQVLIFTRNSTGTVWCRVSCGQC